MPELPAQFLDAVIYLYRSEAEAAAGEQTGGSGCLVSMPSAGEVPPFVYAVTNAHVIRGPSGPRAPVIRLNTVDGQVSTLPLDADNWKQHPEGDDIAVAPLGLNPHHHRFFLIPREVFVQHDEQGTYGGADRSGRTRIGPGDDVFMLGRYIGHDGKQRNAPTVRFGHVAMLPVEPIELESGIRQESFLVEALSLSGYSGSPVFAFAMLSKQQMALTADSGPWLLGIDWGHLPDRRPVLDEDGNPHPDRSYVRQNSGFMGVVPAWKLAELLDSEELSESREKELAKHRERTARTELDVAESQQGRTSTRASRT